VEFIIAYSNSCFNRFGKALSVRHPEFDEIEFSCSIQFTAFGCVLYHMGLEIMTAKAHP